MRILADESLDGPIVAWLRSLGNEVVWAAERTPGAADESLLREACESDYVIITADRDFGELVFRHRLRPPGIVLLRIRARSAAELLRVFQENWTTVGARARGSFVVVGRGRIRIRALA